MRVVSRAVNAPGGVYYAVCKVEFRGSSPNGSSSKLKDRNLFLSFYFKGKPRSPFQKLLRGLKRRTRWFKVKREIEFVRLVGLSQTVRFIASRLRGEKTVEIRVPEVRTPLTCRTSGADRWTLWHVFGRQHFDMPERWSPRLIVDGGANVGYASVYFAGKYPDARIVAVEPNSENCALFDKNCAPYPNVELVRGALWPTSANLVIENPDARSHAFRVSEVPSPTDRSFRGFTIADILKRSEGRRIDLLKLDVEGSEEQLFSSNYDNWIGRVERMMVETHGPGRRKIVSATAKEKGFSTSRIGEYTVLEKGTEPATEEKLLGDSVEHLHGPEEITYGEDELVVVCVVRDGRHYVESFVDHYFSMGVKHIVFLDNNSTDGTVEALKNYDNVTVLRTELPYKAPGISVGNGWTREVLFKQYLVSRFGGENRWCLCVDMDELFDYPYSDVMSLDSLLRYLTGKSYTAVAAQMLDMFSDEPLSGRSNDLDGPLKTSYRFYDVSNMRIRSLKSLRNHKGNDFDSDDIEAFSGGIRQSIFGHRPFLTKYPLVFDDGKTKPMAGGSHRVGNARIADLTGVLLHYKLLNEHFHAQVEQAVREEHRLQGSFVYKIYKETLDREPVLQVKSDTARELNSVNDLLEDQLLVVSDDYVSWVNAEEERNASSDSDSSPLDSGKRDRVRALGRQREERRLRDRRRLIELEAEQRRLSRENRILKEQLQGVRSSRGWRFLGRVNRIIKKVSRTTGP